MMAWRRWCTAVPSSSSGSKMAGFCDLTCDSRPSPNSSMKSASLMFSPNPSPSAPLSLGVSTSSGMSVSLFNVVSPTTSMLATSLIGLSRNCRDSAPQGHESLRVAKSQRPRPLFIGVAPLGRGLTKSGLQEATTHAIADELHKVVTQADPHGHHLTERRIHRVVQQLDCSLFTAPIKTWLSPVIQKSDR